MRSSPRWHACRPCVGRSNYGGSDVWAGSCWRSTGYPCYLVRLAISLRGWDGFGGTRPADVPPGPLGVGCLSRLEQIRFLSKFS